MNNSFYIVDDDKSVRRMLEYIISEHGLGKVVGTADDGESAGQEIPGLQPDIVLIDLLLPGVDGITLVNKMKVLCPATCFVMVSQVTDKEMVSKAYMAGIDFFISKPINVIEVVSVINKVGDKLHLQNIIHSLRVAIGGLPPANPSADQPDKHLESQIRRRITSTLSRLGVLGESGSNDIVEICLLYLQVKGGNPDSPVKMNDLYSALADKYTKEHGGRANTATVEQRIRRAVNKALNNVANLGIEDYGNEFLVSFSSAFFDFAEVRRQMNYIRGTSATPGKISVKKFIEGMIAVMENE